ncbi:hypothetical protein [Microlunatus sp. GCM10028923]
MSRTPPSGPIRIGDGDDHDHGLDIISLLHQADPNRTRTDELDTIS